MFSVATIPIYESFNYLVLRTNEIDRRGCIVSHGGQWFPTMAWLFETPLHFWSFQKSGGEGSGYSRPGYSVTRLDFPVLWLCWLHSYVIFTAFWDYSPFSNPNPEKILHSLSNSHSYASCECVLLQYSYSFLPVIRLLQHFRPHTVAARELGGGGWCLYCLQRRSN